MMSRPWFSGVEIKGWYIVSSLVTLGEFRNLGENVLADLGVTQVDADNDYPAVLEDRGGRSCTGSKTLKPIKKPV